MAVPPGVVFRQCGPSTIPFATNQFDAVVIRSVIEHLDDPERTFHELSRVVKPSGRVLMNLPNKWDYVSIAARFAGPFKSSVLRTLVRTSWDDFPVRYRCNTRRALQRVLERTDFVIEEFRPLPSEPYYLKFFVPLYLAGSIYQFMISLLSLDMLQPSFVVLLRKKGGPAPADVDRTAARVRCNSAPEESRS